MHIGLNARQWAALAVATLAAGIIGCSARRDFPQTQAGWHSVGYTAIFGRLEKSVGPDEDAPPVWSVRFGSPQDAYGGQFTLTPPERMIGYSGGERVELRGHPMADSAAGTSAGQAYTVDSIQLWSGYH